MENTETKSVLSVREFLNRSGALRDSKLDQESETRLKRTHVKLGEYFQRLANEPSVGLFRVEEHIQKSGPDLVRQKHELRALQSKLEAETYDVEYGSLAVAGFSEVKSTFDSIAELMKKGTETAKHIDKVQQDRQYSPSKRTPSMKQSEASIFAVPPKVLAGQVKKIPVSESKEEIIDSKVLENTAAKFEPQSVISEQSLRSVETVVPKKGGRHRRDISARKVKKREKSKSQKELAFKTFE